MLQENGGSLKRTVLKDKLVTESYTKDCLYEAFRRNDWRNEIIYEGSGYSPNQRIHLSDTYDTEG